MGISSDESPAPVVPEKIPKMAGTIPSRKTPIPLRRYQSSGIECYETLMSESEGMMTTDSIGYAMTSLGSLPHIWAYLDPGTGSMMLQIALASVLSASFCLKSWCRQVRRLWFVRE
jgi:hypothetical protein